MSMRFFRRPTALEALDALQDAYQDYLADPTNRDAEMRLAVAEKVFARAYRRMP